MSDSRIMLSSRNESCLHTVCDVGPLCLIVGLACYVTFFSVLVHWVLNTKQPVKMHVVTNGCNTNLSWRWLMMMAGGIIHTKLSWLKVPTRPACWLSGWCVPTLTVIKWISHFPFWFFNCLRNTALIWLSSLGLSIKFDYVNVPMFTPKFKMVSAKRS